MSLDDVYARYLESHHQGRLATIGPGGSPQVKPVGYRYDPELGTIDIGGYAMERSAKYRNIGRNPKVAFVVDDAIGEGAHGMRFLEIRGHAEQATSRPEAEAEPGLSPRLIRIHPRRLVAWNIDPDHPGLHTATVATGSGPGGPVPGRQERSPDRPVLDLGDGPAWEAEQAAAALATELQAGWDARDAEVSNRHFAADILWGSPFGAVVHGYHDLHAIHTRLKQQGRGGPSSRYEIVNVLAPSPGVAIAQIRRTALGDDGQPIHPTGDLGGPFSEMALYVLIRRGGTWWLAAGQNTPVLPPPPR
jgi:PPOX class F420-dependent enzyme/OxyR family protein/uncharacterized protein (TIGR02246 family)